ncbi:ATP-dependent DNA helicase [Ruminiclostridium cellulolyticum]|uniref:DEAD_2 domain protein n=1 Tax=Ruminiclostridium cellulolyticum (strain ATCC 35319 / DSM 5812 / JCM 6584 / H10) TaxID=394503 RepID=B8I7B6_RUMCH|nr:ATP-dependent DNA helicase [Ruminiclostridium cellulolyticum]ACL75040.1 DEAD_2 domain protein [Ruminiclostridium cellulolyticum H10]
MGKPEIKISIRNLVELVLRSGDIDNRLVSSGRMLEGTKIHQKIQKQGGELYNKEVSLAHNYETQDFIFRLEGRADGIISEPGGVVIDEIKSTARPLELIDEEFSILHWAQAKCYAFIYALQNELQNIYVQLTYFHIDTEETKNIRKLFSIKELNEFIEDLLDKYVVWASISDSWNKQRDDSIKSLQFPFKSYRRGQRELAVAVYKTIMQGKKLFAQAPTGIGKTISTLFPAVKALGEQHISKIFYLTAKTITRQVAEEAFSKMRECGLVFRTITLTAKDKICFNKGGSCNPDFCEYAKGHYNRVNNAMEDVLNTSQNLSREVIEEYALKHKVCPFEFSLDLSLWADCIVCDYNYAFDPRVYLKRFFLNNTGDYAFLVDEAHNLVDRAREMFSAQIHKSAYLEAKKLMKSKVPKVAKILNKINSYMVTLRKQCAEEGFIISKTELKDLYRLLNNFISESEEWILKNQNNNIEGFEQLLEVYFDSIAFTRMADFYDERYVTFIETKSMDVRVKLFCLDPSYLLSDAVKRGKTAVFFSATLTPVNYFMDILGGDKEDYNINLASPFDKDNLCLIVNDNISTRYKSRDKSYDKIVDIIWSSISKRTGNYVVFFPSYKYMNEVYTRFTEQYPETNTIIQETSMTEEERESFLNRFQSGTEKSLVSFGVLGGIFSEGIDLKGDRLIGAIIVGVGLPQVSPEQNIIMDYFKNKNRMGFENAYMYPGMNKVLQAAGRVIRSEHDVGTVILLDERFSNGNYRRLFPKHWEHVLRVQDTGQLEKRLEQFWIDKDMDKVNT